MANLRDIKRRIGSVTNSQKITKAMKLVAAAKFARASHAVSSARPYDSGLNDMVLRLLAASRADIESPLLRNDKGETLLVIVSTDRGLCGGLNSNLFKFCRQWMNKQPTDSKISIAAWGKKAASWGRKQKESLVGGKEKILAHPEYQLAKDLATELTDLFLSEKYSRVAIAYTEFQSALSQAPKIVQLLPIAIEEHQKDEQVCHHDFIVEPKLEIMITNLLKWKLISQLFQILLEGAASEHGSRMTAMDSATNNATEVRKKLTLQYNRARQASITKELIEIVSGAEAL